MRLFIFGLGFSAQRFIEQHSGILKSVAATSRSTDAMQSATSPGVTRVPFSSNAAIASYLAEADLLLVSIPPDAGSDPVLRTFAAQIAASGIRRIVYLSSVGVYGDHDGAWIDEAARVQGDGRRQHRIATEAAWRSIAGDRTSILRLAGIYGPGRNALVNLRAGKARRIVKPGQVFNRIHADDIAQAIAAAFNHRDTGVWNVCDDEPAPPQDIVTYAASLMGISPPPEEDFAAAEMTPMARSFYASSNRISNGRLKRELGVKLAFPTYREGLSALWRSM